MCDLFKDKSSYLFKSERAIHETLGFYAIKTDMHWLCARTWAMVNSILHEEDIYDILQNFHLFAFNLGNNNIN